jgi:hypothetical protein
VPDIHLWSMVLGKRPHRGRPWKLVYLSPLEHAEIRRPEDRGGLTWQMAF